MRKNILPVFYLLFYLLFFMTSCAQKKEFTYTNFIMGGPCEITYSCSNAGLASQTAAEIDEELRYLDSLYNFFSPQSWLSALNKNKKARVDRDMADLFTLCDSISRLTGGIFDISVAPLLEAWGFYSGKQAMPSDAAIAAARRRVNFRAIMIRGDSIFIPQDMVLDLGGIAQGYAADRVGKIIRKYGILSAIINIGGDVLAVGQSPYDRPWHVGIKNPRAAGTIESVELADSAVTTSGDYEKYFMINGRRYPHIIDPRTGCPAMHFASVTIFARECAFADGIDTAVAVMGPEDGLKFLDSIHIKGIIYYEENGALKRVTNR
ncbi:MAG TPA: FAD:protein FMN transferase [bacterium]